MMGFNKTTKIINLARLTTKNVQVQVILPDNFYKEIIGLTEMFTR